MIEFKQIIGRGTRLYDGKDYFTIYDFVKAHQHFSDPEWDGEPVEPVEPNGPRPRPTIRLIRSRPGPGDGAESRAAAASNQGQAGRRQGPHTSST